MKTLQVDDKVTVLPTNPGGMLLGEANWSDMYNQFMAIAEGQQRTHAIRTLEDVKRAVLKALKELKKRKP